MPPICQSNCAEVQTVNSASFTRALSPMLANNPSISLKHLEIHFSVCRVAPYKVLQCSGVLRCAQVRSLPQFLLCVLLQTSLVLRNSTAHVVLAACHGGASKHMEKCRHMSPCQRISQAPRGSICAPGQTHRTAHRLGQTWAHVIQLIQHQVAKDIMD